VEQLLSGGCVIESLQGFGVGIVLAKYVSKSMQQ